MASLGQHQQTKNKRKATTTASLQTATSTGSSGTKKKRPNVAKKERDSKIDRSTPVEPTAKTTVPVTEPPNETASTTTATTPTPVKNGGTFTLTVSLPSSTLSTAGTADDEFKVHAQAAVNEFLEKNHKEALKQHDVDEKIDTSTEHVKALTAENWVAACPDMDGSNADSKSPNRARRADLSADDRAKQNRDRNREHARNTRLRKKAYVDELKKTLLEVVTQRDAAELIKKQVLQRDHDQRDVRFRVLQEFLKLRGSNITDATRWSAILEEDFTLVLPATSYRRMACGGTSDKQVLKGVEATMTDAANLSSFLQSLGENVTLQYKCDRQTFLMDGTSAFVDWEADAVGAALDDKFSGFVRCSFSPVTNKLLSVNLFFDSGVVAMKVGAIAVTVGSASSAASASKEDSSIEESIHKDLSGRVPSTIELKSTDYR